jgi:hypothetical protein
MYQTKPGPFARGAPLLAFVFALIPLVSVRAQCVDSSQVNNFKVRSVKVKTLFGMVPKELSTLLDSHRNDLYSSDRASQYINEIRKFYATDPAQEKYERLIANKLKLSVKAGRTWLECVEKVKPQECQTALPGTTECVDVTIKRYFIDIDALDSSPYLLLFPRSALATFYGAMPRPLLALNPGLNASQDQRVGPATSIDTATDLLDLKSIFESESKRSPSPTPSPQATATPIAAPSPGSEADVAEFTFPAGAAGATGPVGEVEEPTLALDSKDTKLLLRLKGWKAVSKDFYDTSSGLTLARTKSRGMFQNLAMEARFDARKLPHGNGNFLRNALVAGFDADLRLKTGAIKLVNLAGKYRWSRNRFFSDDNSLPNELATENGFEGRALFDGTLAKGLARAAVWFDGGSLNRNSGSYKRAAMLFGYGKEIVIPRKKNFHQISPPELDSSSKPCWTSYPDPKKPDEIQKNESTFGIELLVGAGRTWGSVPEYARFYGGGPSGQFLYDELTAQGLTAFPSGPVIRSIGQRSAGALPSTLNVISGGTSFWHANVSVSIPVSSWSRPLIPHEWVASSEPQKNERDGKVSKDDKEFADYFKTHNIPADAPICRDLKSTIKTLVGKSGMNLMINQQARDLLTDAQRNDLRLRNTDNRTPEQQARLDAAELALRDAKAAMKIEVEELFNGEILPVTNFIADHANIIAVKPLLMFDVAHLGLSGSRDNQTRYGAGGGLQIDVVLARFELGYIASLRRAPGDPRGHMLGRLVLKRFF